MCSDIIIKKTVNTILNKTHKFLKKVFLCVDHDYLQEALRTADRFLKLINENVRQKESRDRLEWLQQNILTDFTITFNGTTNKLGPRKLLHHGNLTKVRNKENVLCKKVNHISSIDTFMSREAQRVLGVAGVGVSVANPVAVTLGRSLCKNGACMSILGGACAKKEWRLGRSLCKNMACVWALVAILGGATA